MNIQPLAQTDFYKVGHYKMYPNNTQKVYSNLTARKSRIEGVNSITVFGLQYFIKAYLIKDWQDNFFSKTWQEVEQKYIRLINSTLGVGAISTEHLKELHNLGYLPISIKSLPE